MRNAASALPAPSCPRRQRRCGWLASPTLRYPHAALGSREHAGSLHVVLAQGAGPQELVYRLPPHRVFEDRIPRLVDLDGDGRDEIVVIESDALRGTALVVFGVQKMPDSAPPNRRNWSNWRVARTRAVPFAGPIRWGFPILTATAGWMWPA